jgi:hypothetical protein
MSLELTTVRYWVINLGQNFLLEKEVFHETVDVYSPKNIISRTSQLFFKPGHRK